MSRSSGIRRTRNLLHRDKVEDFRFWAMAQGYRDEQPIGQWEALRLRLIDPSGTHQPIIFYRRLRGEHLTSTAAGTDLVLTWLSARKRRAASSPHHANHGA